MLKSVLSELKCKQIIGIDDGLSNWRTVKDNSFNLLSNVVQFSRGMISPKFLYKYFASNDVVRVFSIYQKRNYSIQEEFFSIINKLSISSPKNRVVQNLFLIVWPSIGRDEPKNTWNTQLNLLIKYLDGINWNPKEIIYFKKHPKQMNVETISNKKYRFEYLPNDDGLPTEIIINSMKNLKRIFSFPTTTGFLLKTKKLNTHAKIEIISSIEPGFFNENLETFNNV